MPFRERLDDERRLHVSSICLNFESSWRYSGVEASSQLITCSAPCEFT